MISIEYTTDFLEGEPGPNFYWRGVPCDFLKVVTDLHCLAVDNGNEISINALHYIQVINDCRITLRSSTDGRTLCAKSASGIIMDLDKKIWRRVFVRLLNLSFERCHDFVEFDDLELEETANVIVSSEAS